MSLLEHDLILSIHGVEETELSGRVGHGGYSVTLYRPKGDPKHGGPVVLLAPGYMDEEGMTREPLARMLACEEGITAGVIKHTHQGILSAFHAREQRSMDVHAASKAVILELQPDAMVEAGHSFGGDNVNDESNWTLKHYKKGDDPIKLAVVHEATPGVDAPHHGLPDIMGMLVHDIGEGATHPIRTAHAYTHQVTHIPHHIKNMPTRIGEAIALREIYIGPGREKLLEAGIPVFDVGNVDDNVVPPSRYATLMAGGHLHSYFVPGDMVEFITGTVLPELGY